MTRRIAPWVFVIAAIVAVSAALAQTGGYAPWQGGASDIRDACGQDVRRLCAGVPRGEGRVVECLMSYSNQISAACRSSIGGGGPARGGYGPYAQSRNSNGYGPGGYSPNAYGPDANGPGPDANGYGPYASSPGRNPNAYGPYYGQANTPGTSGYGPSRNPNADGPPFRQSRAYAQNPEASAGTGDPTGSIAAPGGQTRSYIIHYPAGYDARKAYPLVLLFHGGGGAGVHILSQTRFAAKADQAGFIVVAPNGIDSHWNDGRGTANVGVDDVGFVRQLIANLKSHLPIDPKRIYATGLSNGADFTERLGCELSDTLAAIGAVAGPLPINLLSSCKPGPISMVGIQGDADPGIPLQGGEMGGGREGAAGGIAASATQTMKVWATANGCNLTPTVATLTPRVNDGTRVIKYSYSECAPGTGVTYYVVQGMGHGWPPQSAMAMRNGPPSQNINATDVLWSFFNTHPRS